MRKGRNDRIRSQGAVAVQLYGPTEVHVRYTVETFREGWDYGAWPDAVLGAFHLFAKWA